MQDPSVPSACEVNPEVRFVETHKRLLLRKGTAVWLLLLARTRRLALHRRPDSEDGAGICH